MLYAIKADEAIVYIGRLEDSSEEAWDAEYRYHVIQMLNTSKRGEYPQDPEDFYFLLSYWKEIEHKEIQMVQLNIGDEDEQWAEKFLILVLQPIGNIKRWKM